MVQSLIRQNLSTTGIQETIDAAIANLKLTAADVGAEPAGSVETAIANLASQDDIRNLRQAIAHKKTIYTQWSSTRDLLLRQRSDHHHWQKSGHLVEIISHYPNLVDCEYSLYLCSYIRGATGVSTVVEGKYKPEWSEPVASGVLYDNRPLYYRDLSLVVPAWKQLSVSITTALPVTQDINNNNREYVYLYS